MTAVSRAFTPADTSYKEMKRSDVILTRVDPMPRVSVVEAHRRIKLFIAEEQQILREAYQSFFLPHPNIEVVGASGDTSGDSLVTAALALKPDTMLLGFKILQPATVERLEMVREKCPNVAMVVLSAYYDVKGIKALREFSKGTAMGCAYLVKYTIDTVEQLTQVIYSVAEGRIILDPAVMEGLITSGDSKAATLIKDLTARELEVLSWIAKGYRNPTIAEVLCLDPKTIERHINSIYSKLGVPDSRHARVHAVTLYLRATGLLPAEDFASDGQ